MKTITINVSETEYRLYQAYAKISDRTTSELIREAMAQYRLTHMSNEKSLLDTSPISLGRVLRPIGVDDDILEEMLND